MNVYALKKQGKPLAEGDTSNWSSVKTVLIQQAGRRCKRYASDIIYDIETIQHEIEKGEQADRTFFPIGFRENGTDHDDFMQVSSIKEYSAIFAVYLKQEYYFDTTYKGMTVLVYKMKGNE